MSQTTFDLTQISQPTFLGTGRNRILNGEMAIDQANGGAAVTVNSPSGFFGVDGYQALGQTADGVFTMQRASATPPTGFQFYSRITTTTADASVGAAQQYFFRQIIEGEMVRDFQSGTATAKTFTLSFWARSSLTGTFGGSIMNGGQNRSYVFNYTINSVNTWEQKIITVPGDTSGTWTFDTSAGMRVFWDVGAGSNFEGVAGSWTTSGLLYRSSGNVRLISTNAATLDFTGVQLELGSSATPFEFLFFPQEVALCQRYFEKSYDLDTAPATVTSLGIESQVSVATATNSQTTSMIPFKVPKRVVPTITLYNKDTGATSSWAWRNSTGTVTTRTTSTDVITFRGFDVAQNVNNTDLRGEGHWIADARL